MKAFAIASLAGLIVLAGAWGLQAQDKPKADGTKATSEDVAAALKAVNDAKKLIGEDKKTEAAAKLDEAAKLLAKIQSATSQPATAPAPAAPVVSGETFKGTVHATTTRKIPRLNVDGKEYDLSAAAGADAAVKDTLAKISKGEVTGRYVVKGTAGGSALSVTSIKPE
jgi:hypothetical protein